MSKILSRAGTSLADQYDIEGSIAGLEQLESGEVHVVHDMAETLVGERISTNIRRVATAATIQNTNIVAFFTDLPPSPWRLMNAIVEVDTVSRLTHLNLSMRDSAGLASGGNARESPFWVWDGANEDVVQFVEDGTLANRNVLRPFPEYTRLPLLAVGNDQPERVPDIAIRGLTSGFGAGNVTVTLTIYLALMVVESGVSSHGLGVPSW